MKRPEGFDRPAEPPLRPERGRTTTLPRPAPSTPERHPQPDPAAAAPRRGGRREDRIRSAAAELRAAARARRRVERLEIRRFTRRSRRRRLAVVTVGGLAVLLIAMILGAVYSPLLALRSIRVEGTARLEAGQVRRAVQSQMGTPLALLDTARITAQLGAFPLIRSYSTEIVPPDTLLIRIVERQAVAALANGSGYELVDPAGVPVAKSSGRPSGIPVITLPPAQGVGGVAFPAMTRVLLSLPKDLLARVDTVTARTRDDVAFTITGTNQKVTWGSADDAAIKAQILTRMPQWAAGQPGTFDVASPSTAIFTAG